MKLLLATLLKIFFHVLICTRGILGKQEVKFPSDALPESGAHHDRFGEGKNDDNPLNAWNVHTGNHEEESARENAKQTDESSTFREHHRIENNPHDFIPTAEEDSSQAEDRAFGVGWDWDTLEQEDEYLFANQYQATPMVPKNRRASDDIFYIQPQDVGSYAPGEVIRLREVVPIKYPVNVKAMYQYMVRSTDSLGEPVGIVSTLFVSSFADGEKLLSFQVPTDSPCIDCAPSVDMEDSMQKLRLPFANGWNVIAPDFQGLRAAFGAARLAGHAVLDSVRGALRTGRITRVSSSAKVALWGYSGGSIATGWAAALQPKYAPELHTQLVGAAVGGWITNYNETIRAADGKVAAGLVGMALGGLSEQYRELIPIFEKHISSKSRLRKILESTKQSCLVSGLFTFCGTQFFKGVDPYFLGGESVLHDPTVKRIIEENCVAWTPESGIPSCPLFLHHALRDNIAPFKDTRRAVNNYCGWGIKSFEIHYVKGTGHLSESNGGVPAVITWIKERFEGYAPVSGCRETVWKSLRAYPGHADMNTERRKRELVQERVLSSQEYLKDLIDYAQEETSEVSVNDFISVNERVDPPKTMVKAFAQQVLPLP